VSALAVDLACSLDRVTFARGRLGWEPDNWQAEALRSPARRMLMLCGRQVGKSTTAAVMALHECLYVPTSLTVVVSASLRQAGELHRKVIELLGRLDERPTLVEENRLSLTMASGARVVSVPSTEATVRGLSAVTLLIEDEAARVPDALHHATRPMLAASGGRHLLMSTPNGKQGHFFELWQDGGPEWHRIKVTSEDCPRIGRDFLAAERATLPAAVYAQEYSPLDFLEAEDAVFRIEDLAAAVDDTIPPLWEVA
jgi:hypothetical protein